MQYIIELRALVAQLDRAPPSGGGGCGFDPRRVHHFFACLLNIPDIPRNQIPDTLER